MKRDPSHNNYLIIMDTKMCLIFSKQTQQKIAYNITEVSLDVCT